MQYRKRTKELLVHSAARHCCHVGSQLCANGHVAHGDSRKVHLLHPVNVRSDGDPNASTKFDPWLNTYSLVDAVKQATARWNCSVAELAAALDKVRL
jgi:hypothetical protein